MSAIKRLWRSYGYIVLAIVIPVILFSQILLYGFIPTGSMEPTYMAGSLYIGSRLTYRFSAIDRGDVVVFNRLGTYYVKRVVGMPGDEVSFRDGKVLINGEELDESSYLPEGTVTLADKSFSVPDGSYFVMGDNRSGSMDSRGWDKSPYVPVTSIIGSIWTSLSL